ncbi:hypothetical protein ACXYN8_06290 [Altererythrobacter sp. CAU 1778]
MQNDDEKRARERIDAAIARIEAAARRPSPAPAQRADSEISLKHERLRARVSEALTQVDALIGRLER